MRLFSVGTDVREHNSLCRLWFVIANWSEFLERHVYIYNREFSPSYHVWERVLYVYMLTCLNENLLSLIHRWQIWQMRIRHNCTLLAVEGRDLPCACYATVSRFLRWPWVSCLVIQTPYGLWKGESMVSRKIFLSIVCMFPLELLTWRSASFSCDRLFSTHMFLVCLFLPKTRICHLRSNMNPSRQSEVKCIADFYYLILLLRKNVWMRKLNGSKFEQSFGVRTFTT